MTDVTRPAASSTRLVVKFFIGLALALALPPVSQIWLAFAGLSVLAIVESRRGLLRPVQAFWNGFAMGFGYFIFAFHWIGFAFLVDAQTYLWMMPFAVGGLAAFMATYWGLSFVVVEWLAVRGQPRWLLLPVVLGLMEWLRGYLFTGFPWAAVGLIADGMGGVLQLASAIGMVGLTVMVLLWGMLPGALWLLRNAGWRGWLVPAVLLSTLPVAWAWGEYRLSRHPLDNATGPVVRLVQPNIAQGDKWREDNAVRIFEDLLSFSAAPATDRPQAIIWPESAVPFLLGESRVALERIGKALQPGQTLLAGSIRREANSPGCADCDRYFTSILTIDDQGVVTGAYDKWRLVPGGEYLPLAWLLEPLGFRKVANLPESFSAGQGAMASDVPGIGSAVMLICYEVIFPHGLLPAGPRPRWMVNVTNDGWFGLSVGPHQHLAQVRMRAIEQGLPVARAANTGISAVIDPFGRFIIQSGLETQGFYDARLPESSGPTVFSRFGLLLFAVISFLVVVFSTVSARLVGRSLDST